jgi:hypothetical protein
MGEMCFDGSDLDTFGAESAGVTDFAEGSTGGDEAAMVRACQSPPICGTLSPTKPVIGWMPEVPIDETAIRHGLGTGSISGL